jgi:microcystin-dependent protein
LQGFSLTKTTTNKTTFMEQDVMGFITPFAGVKVPEGWALCSGQLLPIAQHTALFSLLGTMYGGDGKSTFALPYLCGSTAIGAGEGQGLTPHYIGEMGGNENNVLLPENLPPHTHDLTITVTPAAAAQGQQESPVGAVYATTSEALYSTVPDVTIKSYQGQLTTGNSGEGQLFSQMAPVLTINYIICINGIMPQRPDPLP